MSFVKLTFAERFVHKNTLHLENWITKEMLKHLKLFLTAADDFIL